MCSVCRFDGHGLTRDGRLINGRVPACNFTIHRDIFAWAHDDDFPQFHFTDRHFHFLAFAFHAGGLRSKGSEFLHSAARAFRGEVLDVIADAHEHDDQCCRHPLTNSQRGDYAESHQGM